MKILEEYTLSENDWYQLQRAVQAIQEDKASVTIWTNRKDLSRWLILTNKIDAINGVVEEVVKGVKDNINLSNKGGSNDE